MCDRTDPAGLNRSMRIASSDAGVAGAALAYWLQRTGHTPTVIEQVPKFRTGLQDRLLGLRTRFAKRDLGSSVNLC